MKFYPSKTSIIIWLVAIAALLGIILWSSRTNISRQEQKPLSGGGELRSEESSFDFGNVTMAGGLVRHAFALKNPTAEPVTVTSLYTSCMCTTAVLKAGDSKFGPFGMPGHAFLPKIQAVIPPGGTALVEAIFDPAAHGPAGIGLVERIIYIETSTGAPLELRFKANVTP